MKNKLLEMKNITKKFPGVIANDNIDFDLVRGEIHSLLGENGAGKSTLMNILSGLYDQTEGEIFIEGEKVKFDSPKDAIDKGVGMVYQHFMLVPPMTVVENIILGMDQENHLFLDIKKAAKKIVNLSEKFGMKIDPYKKVENLTVGQQQRVEIVKALYRGADILILDEPTAVLTPQESKKLFRMLKKLKSEGHAIIFINHKIDEVKEVSDRITILREGKKINTVSSDISKTELAQKMVGRKVNFDIEKTACQPGEKVLKLENVEFTNDSGIKILKKISLEICEGEILGLAGVDGNGQSEMIQAITGLKKIDKGRILLNNKDITNESPRKILEQNVAYIPEDRHLRGLVLDMDIRENVILRDYCYEPHCKGSLLDWNFINEHAKSLVEEYDVRASSETIHVKDLSGGNQQKLILARELHMNPKLLIAMHPTRGLDIGAIEYVHNRILEQRSNNTAVLYTSTEIQDIMKISDKIAVICSGEIMGIVDPNEFTIEDIGLMMAGTKKSELFKNSGR